MQQFKQCTECAKVGIGPKPLSDFGKAKPYKDGYRSWCKEHANAYAAAWRAANPVKNRVAWLRAGFAKRYGITLEQYQELFNVQRGACAICERALVSQVDVANRAVDASASKVETAHVDHCHESGAVRGLLCTECNTGIGYLKESPRILQKAIDYLSCRK